MKSFPAAEVAVVVMATLSFGRIIEVNSGTGQYPTIQSAATVATAGDTVLIHGGVYHETVTPANSGTSIAVITFMSAPGETAIVSGADAITGWTSHDLTNGRRIYRAQMNWTQCSGTGISSAGMDQIFVDGAMMVEARWPNLPDTIDPCSYRREYGSSPQSGSTASSNTSSSYTDSRLSTVPQSALDNAYVHSIAGAYWSPMTGQIASHTPSSITFTHPSISAEVYYQARGGDWYYVWGTQGLLDGAREWFRGSDGTLYLWTANGDDPSAHRVEAKRRQNVFVLDGKSYITIRDLWMLAGGISTTAQTTFLTIDNVDCRYTSHYSLIQGAWTVRGLGINLRGEGTVVTNSHFAYSAETVLLLTGKNCRAENNVTHDGAYLGCDGYVLAINDAENGQLLHNTTFGCGTNACIDLRRSLKCKVNYNDAYQGSRITADGGLVMATRAFDAQGAEVAYNCIHDGLGPNDGSRQLYGTSGFYCEGNTQGYTVHHNLIWAVTGSGIALGPGGEGPMSNFYIYNNSVYANPRGTWSNFGCGPFSGVIKNNSMGAINKGQAGGGFTGVIENNYTTDQTEPGNGNIRGSGWLYTDPANCDFRPLSGSALIDNGQVIAGITDGFSGSAPDIGALESGKPVFIAGAVITSRHIGGLQVTWDNAPFPDKKFTVSGMPLGRKLPADFKLKIGTATAGGTVAYNIKTGVFSMTGVSPGALTGTQPMYGQIGTETPAATGESINLGGTGIVIEMQSFRKSEPAVRILPGSHMVILKNVERGTPVFLYRLDGSCTLLKTGSGECILPFGSSGIYLLRVGTRLIRLAVI